MILPEIPYTPDMYRGAGTPARVWYSLTRTRTKALRKSLAELAKQAREAMAGEVEGAEDALESGFASLFCEYVSSVEFGDMVHILPEDRDAAIAIASDLPLAFVTRALHGMANELFDADFAKK